MNSFDEKLKIAAAEIKMIMGRHDIGGFVSLVSKTHSEFRLEFPSWSLAQFENDGKGVRIRSKLEDFQSKEEQHIATELTAHFILSARDMAEMNFVNLGKLGEILADHMEIEHESFKNLKTHTEN